MKLSELPVVVQFKVHSIHQFQGGIVSFHGGCHFEHNDEGLVQPLQMGGFQVPCGFFRVYHLTENTRLCWPNSFISQN